MASKTSKKQSIGLNSSFTTEFSMRSMDQTAVLANIPNSELPLIRRYKSCTSFADVRTFVAHSVRDGISWMKRMINGPTQFELTTMEYWSYDETEQTLTLKNPQNSVRNYDVSYSTEFTKYDVDFYNQQMGMILSGFWYKTHAMPLAVVELIAAFDLLFRAHHKEVSPASASGISHMNLAI